MCDGPLIWYDTDGYGAVLHCASCGHLTVTGNPNDDRHQDTPLMKAST